MNLTRKQVEVLLTAPTEEYTGEEYWDVEAMDDDRLEVRYGRFTLDQWSRFITADGSVERWDEDDSTYHPATLEPLVGHYVFDGKKRTYRY